MAKASNQKEIVRLLVLQHGLQKAAELSGVRYDLVRQWSVRGNWNGHSKAVTNVTRAIVDNVANDLAEHERKTKLGLASYATRQAEHLATKGKLKDHHAFRNVTSGAGVLHRWDSKDQGHANVIVNVALLGIDPSTVRAEGITVEPDITV